MRPSQGKCSDRRFLKKLHACMIVQGHEQNILLGSKVLNLYAKFNPLVKSNSVCNKIVHGNLSLWSSVFVGYFRANQYLDVLNVYLASRRKKAGIHNLAITFGLRSCIELDDAVFGRVIHTDACKFGLCNDECVGSSLIGFYCKWQHAREAAKAFDEIAGRDVVAYTSMITGYAKIGYHYAVKAFTVARDMLRNGFEPNRVTLVSLLKCTLLIGALKECKMIHGYAIRKGIGCCDEVFETSLMDVYLKCSDWLSATAIFDLMTERSAGSWNALIVGHLRLGQPSEAFNLYVRMVREICVLDLIALANGLFICADLGCFLVGKSIHCCIIRKGIHLDLVGTTALVDLYSKCKHLTGALYIFNRTTEKDSILFNVMITGLVHSGFVFEAIVMFHEMITKCIRPNAGTIVIMLSAMSQIEDKQKANCIYGYVFRQGLQENTDVANQLVSMYARWGLLESARKVFDRIVGELLKTPSSFETLVL